MKFKSFLFAVMFLAVTTTMQAQNKRGNHADRQTQQMASQLSLSEAQIEKVKVVNEKYTKQIQELRTSNADRAEMRPKIKALRDAQQKELSTYLTKEQIDKWAKIKAERNGRRGQMQKERAANGEKMRSDRAKARPGKLGKTSRNDYSGRKVAQMKTDLNLSDEQAKTITGIYSDYGKRKAEARTRAASKNGDQTAVKELRMEEAKAIDAVLTKEQLAKKAELKAQRKKERSIKKANRAKTMEQN